MHFSYDWVDGERPAGDNRNQIRLAVFLNHEQGAENQFLNQWNPGMNQGKMMELSLGYF